MSIPTNRRRFIGYLVAAPTLVVAARLGGDEAAEALPAPADLVDLGDLLTLAAAPTAHLITLSVGEDGITTLNLPRAEVGQGLTTATAMLVADELDLPLERVRVVLDDARPELLFNQLTGGSNAIRSVYRPIRSAAAAARARLVAAAAARWGVAASTLRTEDGAVVGAGRRATYAELTRDAARVDLGPTTATPKFAQAVFQTTIKSPYDFGLTTQLLNEIPLRMHTGSWRSVYSATTRGAEEVFVDELARRLRTDPVAFRRRFLKTARQRAVLDKVAAEGQWGRPLPAGVAQGVGFHDEYRSCTACLVEIDTRDRPRVTKAVIAGDYGLPINPRGLEAQLLGGLTDAIATTLTAGLHIHRGLPLEGSYSQFHYARQADTPTDVRIFIMPPSGEPGGAGELGVPAAVGAVANAYARATGAVPRSFPIDFPVDFEPFPR
ncbi:molybdopterin cofactor-binding domain-containing protein [Actinokineospora sp. NPDC004072]